MKRFSKQLIQEAESQLAKTKRREQRVEPQVTRASNLKSALLERRLENHFSESLRQLYNQQR